MDTFKPVITTITACSSMLLFFNYFVFLNTLLTSNLIGIATLRPLCFALNINSSFTHYYSLYAHVSMNQDWRAKDFERIDSQYCPRTSLLQAWQLSHRNSYSHFNCAAHDRIIGHSHNGMRGPSQIFSSCRCLHLPRLFVIYPSIRSCLLASTVGT